LKEQQQKIDTSSIEMKGARNYVTYVDKEAERQLVTALSQLLPEAGFLTEEATVEFVEKQYVWIIDPLDGTTNYVHNDTPYSVSIALMKEREILLGVVFDPVAEELYYAVENENARLNQKPIKVSEKTCFKTATSDLAFHIILRLKVKRFCKTLFINSKSAASESKARLQSKYAMWLVDEAMPIFIRHFLLGTWLPPLLF